MLEPPRCVNSRGCGRTCAGGCDMRKRTHTPGPPCLVEGCERPSKTKGYCPRHYTRILRYGDPVGGARPHELSVTERWLAHVDKNGPIPEYRPDLGPCWIWTGAKANTGYGQLSVDGHPTYVHRLAYELLVGPIPDGLTIDHLCRIRACCCPGHLEAISLSENKRRGMSPAAINARRTHCIHGHPFDEANTRITPSGYRRCRRCHLLSELERRKKAAG